MTYEWNVEELPSESVARAVVAAFIALACEREPNLKAELVFFLASELQRTKDPKSRRALQDALGWIQRLKL
jgi:hypothetical protein